MQKLDGNSEFLTYYIINLLANKIIFSSEASKYGLDLRKKMEMKNISLLKQERILEHINYFIKIIYKIE